MPVDNSTSSAIIQAFIAGRELSRQKEQDKTAKEDRELAKQELERRRKLEQEQADRESQIQEQRFNFEKVIHDINKLRTSQEIGEKYSETGIEPSGTKVTKPMFSTTEAGHQPIARDLTGIPQNYVELETSLGKMQVPSPEEYQKRKITQVEALEEPKRKTQQLQEQNETQRQLLVELAKRDEAEKDRKSRELIADKNNASRIAAARVRGTNDKTISQARIIGDKFDALDIRKRFSKVQDGYNFVKTLNPNSTSGVDDNALLIAFVKATDPDTAAREGERVAVEKAANTLAQRFGFGVDRIGTATQYISNSARQDMVNIIKNIYNTEKLAYDNVRKQASKQLETIGADPEIWLKDFSIDNQQEFPGYTIGEIRNNYKYKGGDPKLETSWEEVKK